MRSCNPLGSTFVGQYYLLRMRTLHWRSKIITKDFKGSSVTQFGNKISGDQSDQPLPGRFALSSSSHLIYRYHNLTLVGHWKRHCTKQTTRICSFLAADREIAFCMSLLSTISHHNHCGRPTGNCCRTRRSIFQDYQLVGVINNNESKGGKAESQNAWYRQMGMFPPNGNQLLHYAANSHCLMSDNAFRLIKVYWVANLSFPA